MKNCAALVTDGDGTLLTHKKLARRTAAALDRWCASGRKLILATGESLKQLAKFPDLLRFDLVVAENGALLYWPRSGDTKLLANGRPASLVRSLRREKIPMHVGQVVISTERPHDLALHRAIENLHLDWTVIYNREEAMPLPTGVDKSSGVCAALKALGLKSEVVLGVGDAENDVALLKCCGFGAAVSSAIASLKTCADTVLAGGSGIGVVRLIDGVLAGQSKRNSGRKSFS